MAEAAVLIGIVAAAAQFTEIGCSVLLHVSTLYSRFKSVPQCLRRTLVQIQLLLNLADLVSKKQMTQTLSRCPNTSSETVTETSLSSLSWLESVWKNCTVQAQSLEKIIKSMLCETEDSHGRRVWKKILTVKREEMILQILTEIERYKGMLNLWFGQECLENIHLMRQTMLDLHGQQMAHLANEMTALKADFRAHLKGQGQLVHHAGLIQPKQSHQIAPAALTRNLVTAKTPASPHKPERSSNWVTFSCRCRSMDWKRIIRIRDSKLLLWHCKTMCEGCPMHQHQMCSSETAMRYRKEVGLVPAMVEFAFFLKWNSVFPSLTFSLKTEARVQRLPLYGFFTKLYRDSLYQRKINPVTSTQPESYTREPVSEEKQDYLLSVARKMLLQAYQSGTASPQDVDEKGRTLLHLQIELCGYNQETFLAKMIRLLLSFGLRGDAEDDRFCTVQQALVKSVGPWPWDSYITVTALNSTINQTLLEWTPCNLSDLMGATQILDCFLRWPESALDLGYHQICDIVTRRSIPDLNQYVSQFQKLHSMERSGGQVTPLHFAAAARWPQGTELLLSYGADRYAQDHNGDNALDIAIRNQCPDVVEILLQGDCLQYFSPREERYRNATLPSIFLEYGLYGNNELQNNIVKVLARYRRQLLAARPYHDLAKNSIDSEAIAQKLFAVGFRNLEEYDEEGMTPLIRACCWANMSMVSFLLRHGADPSRSHRDTFLTAGHFLFFPVNSTCWGRCHFKYKSGDELYPLEEAQLLQIAYSLAESVDSRCRCSPDGFSPATSNFKASDLESCYARRQAFEQMIRLLGLSEVDLRQEWRRFVRMEIFDRLGLTHTCIRQFPTVRVFPEQDRLEIEEEEEEIAFELERLMNDYDDWQHHINGDILDCVDTFFDKLDQDLRPCAGIMMWSSVKYDSDILGKGTRAEDVWVNSRGEYIYQGHKEGVGESYVLQSLFD